MPVLDIPHFNELKSYEIVNLGKLYFFKNFFIAEFNEGIDFTFDDFQDGIKLIKNFFGKKNLVI